MSGWDKSRASHDGGRWVTNTLAALGAAVFAVAVYAAPASARSLNDIRSASFGEVGSVNRVRCPVVGRYDCLTFPNNLFELNGVCFTVGYGASLSDFDEAMIVRFRSGAVAVIIARGLGTRFEIVEIEQMFDCPVRY